VSRRWRGGSSRRQRTIRQFVLIRDGWSCRLQLPGCLGRADQAHHLGDRDLTGDDPATMIAACAPCNRAAGDPTRTDPPHRPATTWD
jgi:5-methylcytosine-specific restriction endonuclease McrA